MIKRQFLSTRVSVVQTILLVAFVVSLVVSNIISVRTFDFFGFTMTSGIVVFPITYILSDVFSEVYGYKWSRFTCYLAFIVSIVLVGVFALVDNLPVQPFAQDVANSFTNILGGVSASTFASFIAFVVGDFVNDNVFRKMKAKHPDMGDQKGFGIRAIISSVLGDLCDSCIYLPLAFLVFNPIMGVVDVLTMILLQVGLKVCYELVVLPLNLYVVKKVANYELSLSR